MEKRGCFVSYFAYIWSGRAETRTPDLYCEPLRTVQRISNTFATPTETLLAH